LWQSWHSQIRLNISLFDSWFVYPPATPVDAMVILKTSVENNRAQINDRVSRAMAGRSHEPYYFSTRWNSNGPNIPWPRPTIRSVRFTNECQIVKQNQKVKRESHQGGPSFHCSNCERSELSSDVRYFLKKKGDEK